MGLTCSKEPRSTSLQVDDIKRLVKSSQMDWSSASSWDGNSIAGQQTKSSDAALALLGRVSAQHGLDGPPLVGGIVQPTGRSCILATGRKSERCRPVTRVCSGGPQDSASSWVENDCVRQRPSQEKVADNNRQQLLHTPPSSSADGDFPLKTGADSTLRMVCNLFEVESALVALEAGNEISIHSSIGSLQVNLWSSSAHLLVPQSQDLVVHHDHGCSVTNSLQGEDRWLPAFYAAAPLFTSAGQRLGFLCLCSQRPRSFDAKQHAMLLNVAEMLARQLQRCCDLKTHQDRHTAACAALTAHVDILQEHDEDDMVVSGLSASLQFGSMPHSSDRCTISASSSAVHLNACSNGGGASRNSSLKSASYGHETDRLASLPQRSVRSCSWQNLSHDYAGWQGLHQMSPGELGLQSASFSSRSQPFAAAGSGRARRHSIDSGSHHTSLESAFSHSLSWSARMRAAEDLPFEGLSLGALLGKGSFGKVFRGTYRGESVAVKIVEDVGKLRLDEQGQPLEASITADLAHTGLVATLAHAILQPPAEADSDAPQCWLLLEFCDKGSLMDGVMEGKFRTNGSLLTASPALSCILATAMETAAGMAFLHDKGIIHGDLTGDNVMLKTCANNPHKFCAKVSDFGLSRVMALQSRIQTKSYGTVTHMPPEVLLSGQVSKAADVYAFGVLLWEMYSGKRAWGGMLLAQIVCAITVSERGLEIPGDAPEAFKALLNSCLARDPAARPTFVELVLALKDLKQSLEQITERGSQ